jgi:hypothetical protein
MRGAVIVVQSGDEVKLFWGERAAQDKQQSAAVSISEHVFDAAQRERDDVRARISCDARAVWCPFVSSVTKRMTPVQQMHTLRLSCESVPLSSRRSPPLLSVHCICNHFRNTNTSTISASFL